MTLKLVAGVLPKATPVTPVKSVPEIGTAVPPAVGPDATPSEVIVGAGCTSALNAHTSGKELPRECPLSGGSTSQKLDLPTPSL